MEPVALVTVIALLEYFFFAFSAAGARQAAGIEPPIMTGDVNFERHVRVHANTLEQLVLFLPGIWLFGYYVDALTAAALGLVFVGARFWYRTAYVADPPGVAPRSSSGSSPRACSSWAAESVPSGPGSKPAQAASADQSPIDSRIAPARASASASEGMRESAVTRLRQALSPGPRALRTIWIWQ